MQPVELEIAVLLTLVLAGFLSSSAATAIGAVSLISTPRQSSGGASSLALALAGVALGILGLLVSYVGFGFGWALLSCVKWC
jgi:hypothetical protein